MASSNFHFLEQHDETALCDGTNYQSFPLAEMRKRGYFAGFPGTLAELKEYASEKVNEFFDRVGLSTGLLNAANRSPSLLLRTSAHQTDNDKECDLYALLAWQAQVLHLAKRKPLRTVYVPGSVTRESGDYKRHPAFFGKGCDVRDMIQAAGLADF